MKKKDLEKLGLSGADTLSEAIRLSANAKKLGLRKSDLRTHLVAVANSPEQYLEDEVFSTLAKTYLQEQQEAESGTYQFKTAGYLHWGDDIEPNTHEQMKRACELPIAVKAALMPDAHVGYGLPIGGVLATENAVIPYAVGVDIACRVKLSVFDTPLEHLERRKSKLEEILEKNTQFGIGAKWKDRKHHPVMDMDWSVSERTNTLKDIAWNQLGTSGSGNHFVEFGVLTLQEPLEGLPAGDYVALVSHSGSRGAGARVADYYSKLARKLHPKLPKKYQHLAWLDMDGEGAEYWAAMQLMGEYASANHAIIHRDISRAFGGELLLQVENHHNFAWKEQHDGKEVIVHRKGATPAAKGERGYIPGSMTAPGFLVEGLGHSPSLNSSAHGAGRQMSRKRARTTTTRRALLDEVQAKGVHLISAGLDEGPHAYKDIHRVISAQHELAKVLARFQPKIVKMAPEGEKPED